MLKLIAIAGLLVAAHSLSPCCQDQIWTPNGCINDCGAKKYEDCPDVFIDLYNPSYCGYTTDKTWANFTFQCQACTTPKVIGVKEGACVENSKTVEEQSSHDHPEFEVSCEANDECRGWEFCMSNKCTDRCALMRCTANTMCKRGKCWPVVHNGHSKLSGP